MREALAWHLFGHIGIPAARHTYARVALNGAYRGLYSVIEQIDRRFLRRWFGKSGRGNVYKAYCGDIGCATLEYRQDAGGDDSGRQYLGNPASKHPTYRLKTNKDDPDANTYDDLAALIRVINGVGHPAGSFGSDAYRDAVEQILDVWAFLRWASGNVLLGSWDNYFATPANYYLYNSEGAPKKFLDARTSPSSHGTTTTASGSTTSAQIGSTRISLTGLPIPFVTGIVTGIPDRRLGFLWCRTFWSTMTLSSTTLTTSSTC